MEPGGAAIWRAISWLLMEDIQPGEIIRMYVDVEDERMTNDQMTLQQSPHRCESNK
jgi:hypothetical protein